MGDRIRTTLAAFISTVMRPAMEHSQVRIILAYIHEIPNAIIFFKEGMMNMSNCTLLTFISMECNRTNLPFLKNYIKISSLHQIFFFKTVFVFLFRCDEETYSDYVEFSNYIPTDRKYDRKCGTESGFKVRSDRKFFRVNFHSNDRYDATGFQATYQFSDKANHLTIRNVRSSSVSTFSANRRDFFYYSRIIALSVIGVASLSSGFATFSLHELVYPLHV